MLELIVAVGIFSWLCMFCTGFVVGGKGTEIVYKAFKFAFVFLLAASITLLFQAVIGVGELPNTFEEPITSGLIIILFISSSFGFGYLAGRAYIRRMLLRISE
jgi:hypothetical protein